MSSYYIDTMAKGRVSKAEDPVVQNLFAQGSPIAHIAQVAGVSKETVQGWLDKGAKTKDEPYRTVFLSYVESGAITATAQELDAAEEALLPVRQDRSPLLNHDLIYRIAELVREGHHLTTICRHIGLGDHMLQNWIEKGRQEFDDDENHKSYQDLPPYWPLYVEIEAAKAEPEMAAVSTWMSAIRAGDFRAAKEFLMMRYPERWKQPAQHVGAELRISVDMKQKIEHVAAREGLDPGELEAEVVELVKQADGSYAKAET